MADCNFTFYQFQSINSIWYRCSLFWTFDTAHHVTYHHIAILSVIRHRFFVDSNDISSWQICWYNPFSEERSFYLRETKSEKQISTIWYRIVYFNFNKTTFNVNKYSEKTFINLWPCKLKIDRDTYEKYNVVIWLTI